MKQEEKFDQQRADRIAGEIQAEFSGEREAKNAEGKVMLTYTGITGTAREIEAFVYRKYCTGEISDVEYRYIVGSVFINALRLAGNDFYRV